MDFCVSGKGQDMTVEVDDPGPSALPAGAEVDEGQAMRALERELQDDFPSVPMEQVSILVQCLWSHYDGAPVRDFVALLVRKQAKEELSDHLGARAGSIVPSPTPLPPAPRRRGTDSRVTLSG